MTRLQHSLPTNMSTKATQEAALSNHNASNYTKHANFVYSDKFTSAVLELLAAQPGEAVVDLGCGTGQLTERIKQAVGETGTVCGVDSSEDMVGVL